MRLLVFFDLPITSTSSRREYTRFRKYLIKDGFYMLQESVYSKICLNGSQVESYKRRLRENRPPEGLVQLLIVTERQYANMEYIVGASSTNVLSTDERLVVL